MVTSTYEINRTKNQIREYLQGRVYSYYPKFRPSSLHVNNARVLKKQHKSIIYQFDVANKGTIFKSLVVKKRVFNPSYNNQVVENTEKEFNNLQSLYKISNKIFSIPRPVDSIAKEGILITEKVEGKDLYSYLREAAQLPLLSRKGFLERICFEFGCWLKKFHTLTNGTGKAIDIEKYIEKAESLKNKLKSYGVSEELPDSLIEKMQKLKNEIRGREYPIASKHGDFQPRNIIWDKNAITVLDISSSNKDIIYNDICHFLAHLYFFNIKYPISLLDNGFLKKLEHKFLEGYFEQQVIDVPAIDFFMSLKLLSLFEFTYRRNYTFILRKMRIIYFYSKRIKEFTGSIYRGAH